MWSGILWAGIRVCSIFALIDRCVVWGGWDIFYMVLRDWWIFKYCFDCVYLMECANIMVLIIDAYDLYCKWL